MIDPVVKDEILEDLEAMTPEQQREAARLVRLVLEGREASDESPRPGVFPPREKDPEERRRIVRRVVERMKSNPIPEGAPRRFTRDELHERR
jgi:hypothetical protein